MQANAALDGLAVEDNLVAYLMAELAGALDGDHFDDDPVRFGHTQSILAGGWYSVPQQRGWYSLAQQMARPSAEGWSTKPRVPPSLWRGRSEDGQQLQLARPGVLDGMDGSGWRVNAEAGATQKALISRSQRALSAEEVKGLRRVHVGMQRDFCSRFDVRYAHFHCAANVAPDN